MCGFVTILAGTFLLHRTKDMVEGGSSVPPSIVLISYQFQNISYLKFCFITASSTTPSFSMRHSKHVEDGRELEAMPLQRETSL